jgi:hypothetical protein
LSIALGLILFLSWTLFSLHYVINGSSIDMIKSQRDDIRRMQDTIITLELQMTELQSRSRINQERIDSVNQARLRDYEFLNSRINDNQIPNKRIR